MLSGIVLALAFVAPVVAAYVLFIRWCDRFEPEPWWLLACAFVWGALFATAGGGASSGVGEWIAEGILSVSPDDAGLQAFGATVLAPVFEEFFKGLGVALIALVSALGLKELDGPLDGAIYGGVIGLGFTLTEDTLYAAHAFATSGPDSIDAFLRIWELRTVLLGLSHCTFTALTGLGFGIAAETRSWTVKCAAPIGGYAAAVLLHAIHNALPTYLGTRGLLAMIYITWIVDILFFVLIAVLVVRDRALVVRELVGEVGGLLHARELHAITSYLSIGARNWTVLMAGGWVPFRERRRKQLALVELAFIKGRRRRGESGRLLDIREAHLRQAIAFANQRGVWLGN